MFDIHDATAALRGLLQGSIASLTSVVFEADDGTAYSLFTPGMGDTTMMLCPTPDALGWSLVALPGGTSLWTLEALQDIAGFAIPSVREALINLWETA